MYRGSRLLDVLEPNTLTGIHNAETSAFFEPVHSVHTSNDATVGEQKTNVKGHTPLNMGGLAKGASSIALEKGRSGADATPLLTYGSAAPG